MQPYSTEIEQQMQRFYTSLSEKDRRRYAAIEAEKLGRGGISYVCHLFACDYSTVKHGLSDLADSEALAIAGIRQAGGGRASAFETYPTLDAVFLRVLEAHTAGSPMDETVKWTNLTRGEIAQLLDEAGLPVSVTVVDQLLAKHHFRKRKLVKELAVGESANRDEQFGTIAQYKADYQAAGNPILSMDVKKKS